MAFKITVNENTCIGCGTCAALCPEFFKMADNGKAVSLKPTSEDKGCAQEAADACPVSAITVTEK